MNKKKDKNVNRDEPSEENSSQASMSANAGGEGLHGLDQILAPSEEILAEAMERGFYRFKHDELEHQQDQIDK
jgi:hypothetical protein